jgi:hypothetical protein
MPMTKLTLSADKKLVDEAKKLAEREGTSLSSMFARYLESLLKRRRKKSLGSPGPLTRKATGLAKLPANKTDRELLEAALAEKHGFRR